MTRIAPRTPPSPFSETYAQQVASDVDRHSPLKCMAAGAMAPIGLGLLSGFVGMGIGVMGLLSPAAEASRVAQESTALARSGRWMDAAGNAWGGSIAVGLETAICLAPAVPFALASATLLATAPLTTVPMALIGLAEGLAYRPHARIG